MDKLRFRDIFANAPVSIWEEDFSAVGEWLASLRERGIQDLNAFLRSEPQALRHALSLVCLVEVNEFTLRLWEIRSKEELLDRWTDLFTDETYDVFIGELLAIWEGRNQVTFQCSARTATGRPIHYEMHWFAPMVDGEMNLRQVIVVIVDITERKKIEDKLRENEKNLQLAEQIAKIGYWSRDVISNEITWSAETCRIFGLEPRMTTFKSDILLKYIHPEDHKMVYQAIQDAIEGIRPYDLEFRAPRLDGAVLWVHSKGEVDFDEDGQPRRMFGIVQDITERKRAEEALRESEENFRKIVQQSPIAIELYDSEGLLLEANPQCLELFGVKDLDEVKGFKLFEDPNLPQNAKEDLLRGIQVHYEDEFDFDLIKAKGFYETSRSGKAFINVHISPLFHFKNNISGYLVQVEDITGQKEAEEGLRKERDTAQRYLDLAGVIFVALNKTGEVTLINPKGCEVLGYNKEEIIGRNWFENFIPDWLKQDLISVSKQLLSGNIEISEYHENPIITKDGKERLIAWHNTILKDEEGNVIGHLSSGEDITERKEAQSAIQGYIERLKALREMDRAVLSIQSPIAIARRALSHVRKLVPCIRASVVTFHREAREARVLVADADGETRIGQGLIVSLDFFGNMEEFARGKINIIHDISCVPAQSREIQTLQTEGIRSYINVPIISRMGLIGSLNLGSEKLGSFKNQHLDIAGEVAVSLGVALQNAQLIEEIKKHQQDLERHSAHLIMAQEEERKRISLELHDEVGQALSAIRINLAAIRKVLSPELTPTVAEKLEDASDLANRISDQISELSLTLRPTMLDELGLVPSLQWLLRKYVERSGIVVDFKADKHIERLDPSAEIVLYRIVQEALNNVVKHAEATTVLVHIERRDNTIRILIQDDGKGFDNNGQGISRSSKGGAGLVGMQERVAMLGGDITIGTEPWHGTRIAISIPLKGCSA